jgi:ABC-type protease/lipase transport system fused ATPase/permease subunit
MMQMFDRVLATRNVNTLLYLSLIAGTAILLGSPFLLVRL